MVTMVATGREAVHDEDLRHGLDRLSDAQLVAHVRDALVRPRLEPADSFVLHAPLELMARTALLPYVRPERRLDARLRLVALSLEYEAWGSPAPEAHPDDFDSADDATDVLLGAIRWGALDDVDGAARWLGRALTPHALQRQLAEGVVPLLGAAAHSPIFLYHLPRVGPRDGHGELLRGLARDLARHGTWRLRWLDGRRPGDASLAASPDELFEAVGATPSLGVPGSTFIHPLMSQVDEGVAAAVLGPVTGAAGPELSRALLRAAAWSMLLEPPDHAPYGWSHCLTMPQAVLGLSDALPDPSVALAIAATYVVGFRAALARQPLHPVVPADPGVPLAVALGEDPRSAAGAVWHAPTGADRDIVVELATRAATGHDAHLVKYTLACLDAAADDHLHRRLHLAAAASLVAWWAADPANSYA
jgi:hypothetical protein